MSSCWRLALTPSTAHEPGRVGDLPRVPERTGTPGRRVPGLAIYWNSSHKCPEQDEQAAEPDEPEVVLQMEVVAHQDPAVVLQPRVEPLDLPAAPVTAQGTAILRPGPDPLGPVRCNQRDAARGELGIERIGVLGLVADQPRGERPDEALREGRLDEGDFGGRSALHVHGARKTSTVCQGHDLGPLAPLGGPHAAPPFFARAKVPSMKHSEGSSPPRALRSAASARSARPRVPERTQSWKRR